MNYKQAEYKFIKLIAIFAGCVTLAVNIGIKYGVSEGFVVFCVLGWLSDISTSLEARK